MINILIRILVSVALGYETTTDITSNSWSCNRSYSSWSISYMMTYNFGVLFHADNFSVLSNSCYLAYLSGNLAWNIFAYLFSDWMALFYWDFIRHCFRDWSTDFSWFIMASRWSRDDLWDGYAMSFWNGDTFWYLDSLSHIFGSLWTQFGKQRDHNWTPVPPLNV